MKRRVVTALLAACLSLSLAAPALAAPASLSVDEVSRAVTALGIMAGDENGDLGLSRRVTRAEFVTMAIKATPGGGQVGQAATSPYPDVPSSHWAAPYVISECVMEGTHLGPWPGTVPTGKHLTFTGVNVDRVEHGKILEHGGAVNTFETLWEAGIIRPTE